MASSELKRAIGNFEVQLRDLFVAFEEEIGMRVSLVYLKRQAAEPNNDVVGVELSIEFRR